MSRPQNAGNREALLADLGLAMRRSGTQGSLLSNAVAARIGISANDFECLDIVNLEGAVTPGHLAEATGLTTGAITGVIDRLEKAGFVRRDSDPTDRRRILVRPIKENTQVIGTYYQSLQQRLFALLDDLATPELARLLALYNDVNEMFADEIRDLKERAYPPSKKHRTKPLPAKGDAA
ncbi:MAG: MarR family transcriptional regulator [Alphaproteobacteria bacterium]